MGGVGRGAAALSGLFLLGACAGSPKVAPRPDTSVRSPELVHVVRKGENVYRIARRYGVTMQDILRANDIPDVREIPIGARLRIPGVRGGSRLANRAPSVPGGGGRLISRRESGLAFIWPLEKGRVSSRFGRRRGRAHQGVDVAAPRGTAIRAAEAGRVIHAGGGLGGYGKTVIVKHAGRYSTVYAHANRIHVKRGEFVERGDLLADVGRTGRATGSHLHFEVRRDRTPENPLEHLP